MLDLKGPWRRLAELVRGAITPSRAAPSVHSVRSLVAAARRLRGAPRPPGALGRRRAAPRALLRRSAGTRLEAVVVPESLLDAASMERLRAVAGEVLTWPVNEPSRARELLGLGVRGLISDRPDLIRPCLTGVTRGGAAA